jgi:hypothetical protein
MGAEFVDIRGIQGAMSWGHTNSHSSVHLTPAQMTVFAASKVVTIALVAIR